MGSSGGVPSIGSGQGFFPNQPQFGQIGGAWDLGQMFGFPSAASGGQGGGSGAWPAVQQAAAQPAQQSSSSFAQALMRSNNPFAQQYENYQISRGR